MPPPPKVASLNIFAIRDSVTEVLKDDYDSHPIKLDDEQIGTLYVKRSNPHPPEWLRDFFGQTVDHDALPLLLNSTSAAVLLVTVSTKTFAVAFGHGRYMLNPAAIEPRFGLRTALNGVNVRHVRSVDRKTLEAVSMYTREQASRESSFNTFDMNVQRDLLRSITGRMLDENLGLTVTGKDAFLIRSRVTLPTLLPKLEEWYDLSQQETYRERFPWIDNIAEISDKATRERLDDRLVHMLHRDDTARIWLAPPEMMSWDNVHGFKFRTPHADVVPELDLRFYFEDKHRPQSEVTITNLRRDKVFVRSNEHDTDVDRWRVYHCIHAEIDDGRDRFILDEGQWYRIDPNYAAELSDFRAKLPRTKIDLPDYDDDNEAKYNERAAKDPQLRLMDKDLVKGIETEARSRIEVCDLLHAGGGFIHVKRYSGSSTLSHLFAQGAVAADNMRFNREFQERVAEKYPDIILSNGRFDANQHEIAYAIVAKPGNDDVQLPFFSLVNLRLFTSIIRRRDYSKITLTYIPNRRASLGTRAQTVNRLGTV